MYSDVSQHYIFNVIQDNITYRASGSPQTMSLFAIDKNSGVISVSHSLFRARFSRHEIIVEAVDSGSPSQSVNTYVTIVINENPHSPSFQSKLYNVNMTEHQPVDSLLTTVKATDMDSDRVRITALQLTAFRWLIFTWRSLTVCS